MLVFDQLRKSDPALRTLAILVVAGLGVLLAGLWWVQIVSYRDYKAHLETQSFRTVRIPAVRGKILDRSGVVLAENRAVYNISLFLDELRGEIDAVYTASAKRARGEKEQLAKLKQAELKRKLTKEEKKAFVVTKAERDGFRRDARYAVASNAVEMVSRQIGRPLMLDRSRFEKHYETRLALPLVVVSNIDPLQLARFQEQNTNSIGIDLDVQSLRFYPQETMAGHLLGILKRDDSSAQGEEAFFSYWMPDYRGVLGIEAGFDSYLRGVAGGKSVLVNNMGYRQTENVWRPAEAGKNVRLTIDFEIQKAVERALPVYGADTMGAAVVLDVTSGDILALSSYPTINPNYYAHGVFPAGQRQRLLDEKLRPSMNRATQEYYAPGSIFKLISGLAALETGLDPNEVYNVEPDPARPGKGCIFVGGRKIRDEAPPGPYDFRKALLKSSNAYFIEHGRGNISKIIELARQLHLGERTGLPTRQENAGIFPTMEQVRAGWSDGDTANICIGQGKMSVTPLQMAIMTAAVANGGTVFWPRIVQTLEPADPGEGSATIISEPARVRSRLSVRARNLSVIRAAMLADVEDPAGTGRGAALPGLRIGGKTGTAQVKNERGEMVDHTTWFASFAPFESPKYAVVVMVEGGASGGGTCAPIAKEIYKAILKKEQPTAADPGNLVMAGRKPGA